LRGHGHRKKQAENNCCSYQHPGGQPSLPRATELRRCLSASIRFALRGRTGQPIYEQNELVGVLPTHQIAKGPCRRSFHMKSWAGRPFPLF
jgi:hypothetical protein